MEQILGNDGPVEAVPSVPEPIIPDKAQAEAKLAEAIKALKGTTTKSDGSVEAPKQSELPLETKKEEIQKAEDVPQQFKTKDGELDATKVEKSIQHREKINADKKSLLEKYRALQRETSSLDKEIQETKPKVEKPKPEPEELDLKDFSPEFRKKFREDMEQDFEGTMAKFVNAIVENRVKPIHAELQEERASKREEKFLTRLEQLAADGNEWVLTDEGQKRIGEIFRQDPDLWKTKDPLGYAVRIADDGSFKGKANGHAQTGPRTPILSSGGAIPPPSSTGTVSGWNSLEETAQAMKDAYTNPVAAKKIKEELDKKMAAILKTLR